jgi:NADPH:quinone reductase-like Zn-dependent oxidoreductase
VRALEVRGAWGLDHLAVGEREDPHPGPGQVVVAVAAAALNYRDLLMVQGKYNPKQPLPLIPGSDGAGRVIEVGAGVSRVKLGDRVCPIFAQGWTAGEPTRERARTTLGGPLDGTLAEKIVVSAEGVVEVPEHLSDEEAATLPCAAVTAWNALVTEGGVTAGQTVLVQGTGGVSLFALQLGKALGARVIVTSSSDEKLARAKALGADLLINYRAVPDWGKKAKELTGGRGADLVVEVGGAGTLQQSLAAVRFGGTIALIGNLAGTTTELALTHVFMQRIRLQGILVGDRESFEALNRALALHQIRPVIDRVFPLEEGRAALEHLGSGGHFGKIVVKM